MMNLTADGTRTQTKQVVDLKIENRRPGLWIIAGGRRLFTIELGLERATWDYVYRVYSRNRSAVLSTLKDALDYCRLTS